MSSDSHAGGRLSKKNMLCNFLRNREEIADFLSILSTEILLINSLCLRYLSYFIR